MRDEGWIASHKSQCAHHNQTRNFFSHEKQISDCFHVKQGECVNPRNKKKIILLTTHTDYVMRGETIFLRDNVRNKGYKWRRK